MKLWARLFKNNHMLRDTVIENYDNDTRTHRIMKCLEEACYEFDLAKPIWLKSTISDFQLHNKCRFTKDSFVEEVPFDYMEISILEE